MVPLRVSHCTEFAPRDQRIFDCAVTLPDDRSLDLRTQLPLRAEARSPADYSSAYGQSISNVELAFTHPLDNGRIAV